MVVEELIFAVTAAEREAWLDVEAEHWDAFLCTKPGFVRKQVLVDDVAPDEVRVLVWWETLEQWKAITLVECAEVDARMGSLLRDWRCNTLHLLRDVKG